MSDASRSSLTVPTTCASPSSPFAGFCEEPSSPSFAPPAPFEMAAAAGVAGGSLSEFQQQQDLLELSDSDLSDEVEF